MDKLYTILVKIKRKADGTFDRLKDGEGKWKKQVTFLEAWGDGHRKKHTQEQLDEHFKDFNAGLALETGKVNGLTVIDFDTKNDPMIMDLFQLSPTKTVETEEGLHFYYKYNPEFPTGSNVFGKSIDCRNDKGVIFCPPTPNYKPKEDTIAEITPEAVELLKSKMQGKKKIDLANSTTRNDDLFRMACGWIDHYDEKEVWSRMVKSNRDFRKGSLDDKELETIYQQVIKYKKTGQKLEDKEGYHLVN